MFWNEDRQRCGRIVFPSKLKHRLEALEYPALDEDMRFDAAFAYAIFIALRIGMSLRLCGDPTVWNADWGALLDLDGRVPVDLDFAVPLN